jgi:membrane-bound ClpP family serine protease
MLVVVVAWLVLIFVGFSAIAPPNATARLSLVASALCSAGAIFLILELDRPFDGLLHISSEQMMKVLTQLGK